MVSVKKAWTGSSHYPGDTNPVSHFSFCWWILFLVRVFLNVSPCFQSLVEMGQYVETAVC